MVSLGPNLYSQGESVEHCDFPWEESASEVYAVFPLIFCFWQRIRTHILQLPVTVFFDKLCIAQHDEDMFLDSDLARKKRLHDFRAIAMSILLIMRLLKSDDHPRSQGNNKVSSDSQVFSTIQIS